MSMVPSRCSKADLHESLEILPKKPPCYESDEITGMKNPTDLCSSRPRK